jgi:hypothetical protein
VLRSVPRLVVGLLAAVVFAPSGARAGDVTAALVKQILVIRSDDSGSAFVVSRPAPASRGVFDAAAVVSPLGKGTTVNGVPQAAVFSPLESLRFELGDGLDSVQIVELTLPGQLSFDGGEGNNQVYLDAAGFGGTCTFRAGDAPDLLQVGVASGCGGDVKILLGDGINEVRLLAGSAFSDDLSLKLGAGSDEVTLGTSLTGSAKLSLGEGNNTLNAPGFVGDDFSCKSGAGIDTLSFLAFEAGGRVHLKTGPGNNVVVLGAATTIGEGFKLKAGSGDDTVTADGVQIGEDAVLVLSAGDNVATVMNSTIGDDLVVKAKAGSDTAALGPGNTIGGETILKGVP